MPREYFANMFSPQLWRAIESASVSMPYRGGGDAAYSIHAMSGAWVDTERYPYRFLEVSDDRGMLRGTTKVDPKTGKSKIVKGRLLRVLRQYASGGSNVSDKSWEQFGNYIIPILWPVWEFELLSGRDVKEAYHERNYAHGQGTLSNSCMRYASCNSYLQLYWRNPDVCKLLVSKDSDGKINGRCLIWTCEDGTIVADRVYGTDATQSAFAKYINEQGWWARHSIDHDGLVWDTPEGRVTKHLRVQLKGWQYGTYPYMDTFRNLDSETGVLSTSGEDGDYQLGHTGGGRDYLGPRRTCSHCGGGFRNHNGWYIGTDTEPSMCYRCGQAHTHHCMSCSHHYLASEMVQDRDGYWYCAEHRPVDCARCGRGMPSQAARMYYRDDGSRICVHCYDRIHRAEQYETADGYTLTRSQYDARVECQRCHRYWSQDFTYLSFSGDGAAYTCRDCQRAAARERMRSEVDYFTGSTPQWASWIAHASSTAGTTGTLTVSGVRRGS